MIFPESDRSESIDRRRSSNTSDRSRQRSDSFLDNAAVRASFSFKAQLDRDAKLMAEEEKFTKYKLKLKVVSLFFMILALFMLLNACIGASSAPFYDKFTVCSKMSLNDDCEELMRFSSTLYGFELIGSMILVVHGLIGMTLLEYIKKLCLIKTLNYYTKGALLLYSLDALLRTAIYLKIKNLVAPVEEEDHKDDTENFTGFLAVFCQNKAVAVIITIVLLSSYTICFLSTCFMWKLSNDLEKTVLEEEDEKKQTLLSKQESSSSGSKIEADSKKSAVKIMEKESLNDFEDFSYNKQRA